MEILHTKPTKSFFEDQIISAKKHADMARQKFEQNMAIISFCQEIINRNIFVEEEKKEGKSEV